MSTPPARGPEPQVSQSDWQADRPQHQHEPDAQTHHHHHHGHQPHQGFPVDGEPQAHGFEPSQGPGFQLPTYL